MTRQVVRSLTLDACEVGALYVALVERRKRAAQLAEVTILDEETRQHYRDECMRLAQIEDRLFAEESCVKPSKRGKREVLTEIIDDGGER